MSGNINSIIRQKLNEKLLNFGQTVGLYFEKVVQASEPISRSFCPRAKTIIL